MTPYFFTYDRINYGRYIAADLFKKLTLCITFPDAHQSQLNGEFAVQCSYKNKRDRRNIEWSGPYYFQKLKNETLMVTLRDKYFRIMAYHTQEVSALCCSYEEADTQIPFSLSTLSSVALISIH